MCLGPNETKAWEAGTHYIARESEHRILLPDLPCLGKLRHRWCWQKRQRPYVPVWSHAKVPKVALSPEENARLLCVYMRPWTLNPADATSETPLLSRLNVVSDASQMCSKTVAGSAHAVGMCPKTDASSGQPGPQTSAGRSVANEENLDNVEGGGGKLKRRRCTSKTKIDLAGGVQKEERSYARSGMQYIHGNGVSETSKRFIPNLLSATAARGTVNLFRCTVCELDRAATEFKYSVNQLQRQEIRRCNSCHTCKACGTFYANAVKMQWNSRLCCVCYKKQKQMTCTVCNEKKLWMLFHRVSLSTQEIRPGTDTCVAQRATLAKSATQRSM